MAIQVGPMVVLAQRRQLEQAQQQQERQHGAVVAVHDAQIERLLTTIERRSEELRGASAMNRRLQMENDALRSLLARRRRIGWMQHACVATLGAIAASILWVAIRS